MMAGLDWPAPLPPSLRMPLVSWGSIATLWYIHVHRHVMNTVHALLPACLSYKSCNTIQCTLCVVCPSVRLSIAGCLPVSHSLSLSLSLSRTEPSGAVTNLSASLVGNGEHVANVSWSPLASEFWNGIPYGYYVSI